MVFCEILIPIEKFNQGLSLVLGGKQFKRFKNKLLKGNARKVELMNCRISVIGSLQKMYKIIQFGIP